MGLRSPSRGSGEGAYEKREDDEVLMNSCQVRQVIMAGSMSHVLRRGVDHTTRMCTTHPGTLGSPLRIQP